MCDTDFASFCIVQMQPFLTPSNISTLQESFKSGCAPLQMACSKWKWRLRWMQWRAASLINFDLNDFSVFCQICLKFPVWCESYALSIIWQCWLRPCGVCRLIYAFQSGLLDRINSNYRPYWFQTGISNLKIWKYALGSFSSKCTCGED